MATSVNQSIPPDSPKGGVNGHNEGSPVELSETQEVEEPEAASPFSDIHDPTGLFCTELSSPWSNQPATPSSVNTTSRTFLPSNAPSPPPLPPQPLPRIDPSGPSSASRPFRPLPQPPTISNGPPTPPNLSPSTSSSAPIDPYVGVSTQPNDSKRREVCTPSSPASLSPTELPSPEITDSSPEIDDTVSDDESNGTRSDIDESGVPMQPLPPYRARGEHELTLEIGPPGEVQPFPLPELNSNVPQLASRSAVSDFGTYDSGRTDIRFLPSDPGPSNYGSQRYSYGGRDSYDDTQGGSLHDHDSYDRLRDARDRVYHNDFASDEPHVLQGANLGRRNSRFILVGPAPSDFGSVVPRDTGRARDNEHIGLYEEQPEEDDTSIFINYSLLSNLAMLLHDKVPRDTHTKGSIPYPNAFTGKDIVSTIHSHISRDLRENHGGSLDDRRPALLVSRSLQSQLFFYEVEWGGRILQDGVGDVYMFLDDFQDPSERAEIPTGVVTVLSRCYSPSCGEFDDDHCYSYSCPRKGLKQLPPATETLSGPQQDPWPNTVPEDLLNSLTEYEINRQTIIHKLLSKEEQYVHDLNVVETVFIEPLRNSGLHVSSGHSQEFVDEVFGNIIQVRDINKRLLEALYVRQREQAPIVGGIGDIFLDAATTDFKDVYPTYIGHHPIAERLLREELERNPDLRVFIETCARRQTTRLGQSPRLDLKHFLNRPVEHLQKYRVLLEAIYKETDRGNPDGEFLTEAIKALNKLQTLSQVHTFQETAMRGSMKKWEWSDLVTPPERQYFSREEAKRQSIIFELIATEMDYVKDLHNINKIFITPLQEADPSIIPRDRLPQFLQEVFSNIQEITMYHQRLVEQLHHIQREHHPRIPSVTAAVFDTALNFREAYLEYIPNYPIAAYRVEDEREKNVAFQAFHDNAIRHPSAQRLPMTHFIYRPIPRLLRYELLLKGILEASPPGHEDRSAIPNVIEILKSLGKDTEPGVMSAKQKVDLWKFNSSIVFKPGEHFDMDLLNDSRSLIHTGKLYRQSEGGGGIGRSDWTELFVTLFDNYFVMTKPKSKDNTIEYHVTQRPIPLDLLSLVKFDEPPIQRPTSLFRSRRNDRNPQSPTGSGHNRNDSTDNGLLYPLTFHHTGRPAGQHVLYAESTSVRTEWQRKLDETLGLRRVVMELNKVFEMETLSQDTFLVSVSSVPSWNDATSFGGKVTCSVPFSRLTHRPLALRP